jgi:hypothetical protein
VTSRTVLKFNPNLPVDVRLDYGPEGKLHEKTGDYQYTVNGNSCVMFLPDTARNQLLRTHAAKGDLVRICKSVAGRSTTWNVEVLSDAAEPEPTPTPGPRVVAPARTNGANALQPKPITPLAAHQPEARKPQPVSASASHPLVERYTRMFAAAAQSLKATHQQLIADPFYAGLEPPTWEDIRATAIHWGISLEKREGN